MLVVSGIEGYLAIHTTHVVKHKTAAGSITVEEQLHHAVVNHLSRECSAFQVGEVVLKHISTLSICTTFFKERLDSSHGLATLIIHHLSQHLYHTHHITHKSLGLLRRITCRNGMAYEYSQRTCYLQRSYGFFVFGVKQLLLIEAHQSAHLVDEHIWVVWLHVDVACVKLLAVAFMIEVTVAIVEDGAHAILTQQFVVRAISVVNSLPESG